MSSGAAYPANGYQGRARSLMALEAKSRALGEVGDSRGLVKAESIGAILDAGSMRTDLLLAATRELTALLGDRGVCVSVEGSPWIAAAPSDPTAEGRSVDLAQHPELAGCREKKIGSHAASIEDGPDTLRLHQSPRITNLTERPTLRL